MKTNIRTANMAWIALFWVLILLLPAAGLAEGAGRHNKATPPSERETMKPPDKPTGLRIVQIKSSVEESNTKTQNLASEIDQALDAAARLLREIAVMENRIPKSLIGNAAGVALFPETTQAAALVDRPNRDGILMLNGGNGWNGPIFISLIGDDFGDLIGQKSADLFVIFENQAALDELQKGKMTLGAKTSVVSGPRKPERGASEPADVRVYQKTEELFAVHSVQRAMLKLDKPANETYYQYKDLGRAYYGEEQSHIPIKDVKKDRRVEQMITILSEWN